MLTKTIFIGIVAAIFLQRLFELRLSQRNEVYILTQGGREHTSNYLQVVKMMQLSWLLTMIAEVLWLDRSLMPVVTTLALMATVAGQCLRYLSMRSLGRRWTLPLMTIPGTAVIDQGIYRYMRHPNWLGVVLEITAVPLIHGAYLTAILYTVVNAFLMNKRIRAEEQALSEDNNYACVFAGRPRFIPKIMDLKNINGAATH